MKEINKIEFLHSKITQFGQEKRKTGKIVVNILGVNYLKLLNFAYNKSNAINLILTVTHNDRKKISVRKYPFILYFIQISRTIDFYSNNSNLDQKKPTIKRM